MESRNSIETVAEQLRTLYEKHRRLSQPSFNLGRNTPASIWTGAAEFLLRENVISPEEYVKLLFRLYPDPNMPPYVNFINSARLKEAARQVGPVDAELAEQSYRLMCNLLEAELKSGRPLTTILTDTSLYFNPAFRLFQALIADRTSVAKLYLESARTFLKDHPAQHKLYSKLGVEL